MAKEQSPQITRDMTNQPTPQPVTPAMVESLTRRIAGLEQQLTILTEPKAARMITKAKRFEEHLAKRESQQDTIRDLGDKGLLKPEEVKHFEDDLAKLRTRPQRRPALKKGLELFHAQQAEPTQAAELPMSFPTIIQSGEAPTSQIGHEQVSDEHSLRHIITTLALFDGETVNVRGHLRQHALSIVNDATLRSTPIRTDQLFEAIFGKPYDPKKDSSKLSRLVSEINQTLDAPGYKIVQVVPEKEVRRGRRGEYTLEKIAPEAKTSAPAATPVQPQEITAAQRGEQSLPVKKAPTSQSVALLPIDSDRELSIKGAIAQKAASFLLDAYRERQGVTAEDLYYAVYDPEHTTVFDNKVAVKVRSLIKDLRVVFAEQGLVFTNTSRLNPAIRFRGPSHYYIHDASEEIVLAEEAEPTFDLPSPDDVEAGTTVFSQESSDLLAQIKRSELSYKTPEKHRTNQEMVVLQTVVNALLHQDRAMRRAQNQFYRMHQFPASMRHAVEAELKRTGLETSQIRELSSAAKLAELFRSAFTKMEYEWRRSLLLANWTEKDLNIWERIQGTQTIIGRIDELADEHQTRLLWEEMHGTNAIPAENYQDGLMVKLQAQNSTHFLDRINRILNETYNQ